MSLLERDLGCHLPGAASFGRPMVGDADAATASGPPVIALVGRPNVGKSTFFGRASERFAETANLPGTTVEVIRRDVIIGGRPAVLVDLPGTFSLVDQSDGLGPFWTLLLGVRPDAILAIIDVGDLARHLPLVLACRDLGLPMVVAANLSDEAARRGNEPDLGRLSQLLAVPVVRTIGRSGVGVDAAVRAVVDRAARSRRDRGARRRATPVPPYPPPVVRAVSDRARAMTDDGPQASGLAPELAAAVDTGRLSPVGAATIAAADLLDTHRWDVAERWAAEVDRRRAVPAPLADRLGRLVTAPWPGLPLFLLVTVVCLVGTMQIGTFMATILADAWGAVVSPVLTTIAETLIPIPALSAATLWALDSGLLAMVSVGLPFVLVFYLVLATLEDSGYLAAAAVLSDRVFNALGLPGRAAIPVLAATGCNVPAIYGTRVLDSRRERLLGSFLIVLTPCSARSAVIIAALAPFVGPAAALAAFGVVVLVAIASGLLANAIVPGRQSPLVLEIPSLRLPIARQVLAKAGYRFRSFVRTAAPVMIVGSFVLGLAWEGGAIGPLQEAIGPLVSGLLGLPPVAGVALILAFLRKELALQLLLVLAVAQYGAAANDLSTFMAPGQLFVFAVVSAISVPCMATLASLVDEFGGRAAMAVTAAVLAVGLGVGAVLARIVVA